MIKYFNTSLKILIKVKYLFIGILYYYFLFYLLIDSISGFFQLKGINFVSMNLSAFFRIFILLISVYILLFYYKKHQIKVLLLFGFYSLFFFLILVHSIYFQVDNIVSKDIHGFLKLSFLPLIFVLINILINENYLNYTKIKKIIIFNLLVVFVNVTLGIVGIGISKYGVSSSGVILGGKGFFFSGNELNTVIIILLSIVYYYVYKYEKRFLMPSLLIFSYLSLVSFSKTTLIFFIVLTLILFLINFKKYRYMKYFVILLIGLTFMLYIFSDLVFEIYGRLMFFIEKSGVIGGITSDRTFRLSALFDLLLDGPITLLLGSGYEVINIEMDFLDVLVSYGLIGLIACTVFCLIQLIKLYNYSFFLFSSFGLIILVSLSSGHIVFSTMGSLFFAILLNIQLIDKTYLGIKQ